MPTKVKKTSNNYKVICGCEICIYLYMIKYELNEWI